jgi:hypothetical protein
MNTPPQGVLFADISDYQSQFNASRYARSGRRVLMVKHGEGEGNAGGELAADRIGRAHHVGVRVIHYLMARYNDPPDVCLRNFCERIKPTWHTGDKMELDIEAYSGPPDRAAEWVAEAQRFLELDQSAPRRFAMGYTNESYLLEGGPRLWNLVDWWHIATYDGRLLGRGGEPRLPRGCKAKLLGKQYTDGVQGAYPRSAPGIGPCDDSILTRAGHAHLLGVSKTPRLKRRRVPSLKGC